MSNLPKWDPAVLLQIHNPEAQGWSCKGVTQSGRRCRRPLSQSKRDNIFLLLPKLSPLPPKNAGLDEQYLDELSRCCFCYDHDDDDNAEEILEQWGRDLMRARSVAEDGTRRFTFTGGGGVGAPSPSMIAGRQILTPKRILGNSSSQAVKSESKESSGITQRPPPSLLNQSPGTEPKSSPEPRPQPDTPNKPSPPPQPQFQFQFQPPGIKREQSQSPFQFQFQCQPRSHSLFQPMSQLQPPPRIKREREQQPEKYPHEHEHNSDSDYSTDEYSDSTTTEDEPEPDLHHDNDDEGDDDEGEVESGQDEEEKWFSEEEQGETRKDHGDLDEKISVLKDLKDEEETMRRLLEQHDEITKRLKEMGI